MKNVPKRLAKSVLIPLGLTTAAAATDVAIHNWMFGSGNTILITSNEEMNDIMKIVKSPEASGLLKKALPKQLTMKQKNKIRGFLRMLLSTLGASLLGNL